MTITKTDNYFKRLFKERWKDQGNHWFKKFIDKRDQWESHKRKFYELSETSQMVDHGWDHARDLHISLPRFLWSLERNKYGKSILDNAAELYALLVSAYLHDIGMHLRTNRLYSDFREAAKTDDFPYQSEYLTKWLSIDVHKSTKNFPSTSIIRHLHPEIGAWLCKTSPELLDWSEQTVIAQIVYRHAKRIPKETAGEERLKLENEIVRIGLIASLIAIADSCQLGFKRVSDPNKHLETLKDEIAQREKSKKHLNGVTDGRILKKWHNSHIKILKEQPEHILKHSRVDRVSFGPSGFVVVPAFWQAKKPWFQSNCAGKLGNIIKNGQGSYTNGFLLNLACEDIKGELDGPKGSKYVKNYLMKIFGNNIIPPIPQITARNWSAKYKELVNNTDERWEAYFSDFCGKNKYRKKTPQVRTSSESELFKESYDVLTTKRKELSDLALKYYTENESGIIDSFPLLAKKNWVPSKPIPLDKVKLIWNPTKIDNIQKEAMLNGYPYSALVKQHYPDKVLEDRFIYRLNEVCIVKNVFKLSFSSAQYFDCYNTCMALSHDFCEIETGKSRKYSSLSRDKINVFDFSNRFAALGVSTLLIVVNKDNKGKNYFYLHERTSAQLAEAMNTFHVVPAGTFQPDGFNNNYPDRDFDLSRTIKREFAEELLGRKEVEDVIRDEADFLEHSNMNKCRKLFDRGRLYFMGLGIDPLTTKPELLTCLLIDDSSSDNNEADGSLWEKLEDNFEGKRFMVPFSDSNLERYINDEKMLPTGAACLILAKEHFSKLLQIG